ncbi:hypothetical protein CC1G_02365 [Coprinopsis cinerea okayama7|uniref:DUF6533 domain-containing protein n=1 Tax=Coprinopsis cinerea (strain Okayama-7 / 130 / ATCC MYA-4618 / FGSC 9003) TaxID=240176 RepID=A8N7V8_COPC7|nr:hypothetical protein CC1G_02365 [Coprinopsis cinerea okayama7\|eukprot:XP_001830914.2 hypothetical protein CC1G_02365 [Coprinopsis cinerea okayama7\
MAPSAAELAMVEAARQDPIVRRDLTNMAMANTGLLFILFYDHLITLPDEVRVIWPMPWKLPKILFMVNRYFVPAFLIFHNFKAIYRGARRVKHFLYAMFGLQLLATGILSGIIMPAVRGYSGQDKVPGCLYIMPQHMEMIWLPGTLFEALLAVMTIYQGIVLGFRSPLLRVLVRDAFIYFIAIFTCLLASLIYPKVGQRFLAPPLLLPSTVIASLGTARITINLRTQPTREQVTPVPDQIQLRSPTSTNPVIPFYSTSYGMQDQIKIKMETFVETSKP